MMPWLQSLAPRNIGLDFGWMLGLWPRPFLSPVYSAASNWGQRTSVCCTAQGAWCWRECDNLGKGSKTLPRLSRGSSPLVRTTLLVLSIYCVHTSIVYWAHLPLAFLEPHLLLSPFQSSKEEFCLFKQAIFSLPAFSCFVPFLVL